MIFDVKKYEMLSKQIADFLLENPEGPNQMPDAKFDTLWDLINAQNALMGLLVDKPRRPTPLV